MLMEIENRMIAFPAQCLHRLDVGGRCPMEIKHSHPQNKSEDERFAQLKNVHRTCIALIMAQKNERKESA